MPMMNLPIKTKSDREATYANITLPPYAAAKYTFCSLLAHKTTH